MKIGNPKLVLKFNQTFPLMKISNLLKPKKKTISFHESCAKKIREQTFIIYNRRKAFHKIQLEGLLFKKLKLNNIYLKSKIEAENY